MKNLLIVLISCVYFSGYSQNWQWAKLEQPLNYTADAECHDPSGNIYIVSRIPVTASSPVVIGNYTISNVGLNYCLIKYDAQGNILWVWSHSSAQPYRVACDNSGNVLLAGTFINTVSVTGHTIVPANSVPGVFVAKFNAAGTVQWLKSGGASNISYAYGICADAQGNCYVTGRYGGNALSFGTFTVSNTNVSNNNYYLIKYDSNGNEQWLSGAQSGGFLTYDVCMDPTGNILVCGQVLGVPVIGTYSITNSVGSFCVLKYNSAGVIQWHASSVNMGGTSSPNCITSDAAGNSYVSGSFLGGTLTIGSSTFTSNGNRDYFLAKIDNSGNLLWGRTGGGSEWEEAYSHANYSGGLYVASRFASPTMTIGSFNLSRPSSVTQTAGVMVMARYDASGNILDADVYEGGVSTGLDLSIYNNCVLYYAGNMINPVATYGNYTLTNSTSTNTSKVLIGKMYTEGVIAPTLAVSPFNQSVCPGTAINATATGASSYTSALFGSATPSVSTSGNIAFSPTASAYLIVSGSSPSLSCEASTTIPVFVWPNPTVTAMASHSVICPGENVTINAAGAISYSWSNGSNSASTSVSPTVSTSYTVIGINNEGCLGTGVVNIVVVPPCTGINELRGTNKVKIYPNPANETITFDFSAENSMTKKISIYSILGNEVCKIEIKDPASGNFQVHLDVNEWPNGVYIIDTGFGKTTFIKQ